MVKLKGIDLWEFEILVFVVTCVLVVLLLRVTTGPFKTWSFKRIGLVVLLEGALLVSGYYYWLFFLVQWE